MKLLLSILSIAVIDLVLSGDNATVIGLAVKDLPVYQRKQASFLGAGIAVALRVALTAIATILMQVPYLNAIGGIVLLWITWRFLNSSGEEELGHEPKDELKSIKGDGKFWGAVGTIVIADLSMALDNIMGVAGAAHGDVKLMIFGLGLSIPILVLGANWVASLMNRYPVVVYLGGGVLVHTALTMIFEDRALNLEYYTGHLLAVSISWGIALAVLGWGILRTRRPSRVLQISSVDGPMPSGDAGTGRRQAAD